jgi:transcriptional regulator with XRE-family HTH domain
MERTLGERIRQAREEYGMSQAELARRSKVSQTTMNEIEQGETLDPRVSRLIAVADVLHLSLDALLGREEYAPRPPRRKKPAPADAKEEAA